MPRPLHKNKVIITLYNVCSVHRGMFSTSGVFITLGDIMSALGGVQYIGGYHEYIGGIKWVHWGMFSTSGDTMNTSGDIQYVEGYHKYIRGISWVHKGDIMSTLGDVQYIGVFNRNQKVFTNFLPHVYHDIPRCTEHSPMYSWYPPDVLMVSPMYWTSPNVLMISPTCIMISPDVRMISPNDSWYPLNVPMVSPQFTEHPWCTEHPPMYWTHIIQGDYRVEQSSITPIALFWLKIGRCRDSNWLNRNQA